MRIRRQGELHGRNQDPLFYSIRSNQDSEVHCQSSNGRQLFELRIAQQVSEDLHQIYSSGNVAEEAANGNHPTCFRTSMLEQAVVLKRRTYPMRIQAVAWELGEYQL